MFACVSVALFMVAVDQTIVATALPSIQADLHTRINWAGWTITTYSLAQVLAMPVAGKLSDQFGRKTIFMCAAAVFTIASLCCGLSNSIYLLIALRGVQALGGGCFMPSASGIVADQFGPDRDRALAMFTSILPIGGIVGPVLGGLFVTYWSWRGIFLINVPIGVGLIIACAVVIPRSTRRARTPVDVLGVVLLGAMLLAVMFGFAFLGAGSSSLTSWSFLIPEGLGLTAGLLFMRHMQRHAAPFIPAQLLYGHGFGVMNLINFVYGGAVLGLAAVVPGAAVAAAASRGALRVAGGRGRADRAGDGHGRARDQQRHAAARAGPGGRDRRVAGHVPPVRLDPDHLGDDRPARHGPRSGDCAEPRLPGLRGADGGADPADPGGARPSRPVVRDDSGSGTQVMTSSTVTFTVTSWRPTLRRSSAMARRWTARATASTSSPYWTAMARSTTAVRPRTPTAALG